MEGMVPLLDTVVTLQKRRQAPGGLVEGAVAPVLPAEAGLDAQRDVAAVAPCQLGREVRQRLCHWIREELYLAEEAASRCRRTGAPALIGRKWLKQSTLTSSSARRRMLAFAWAMSTVKV